MVASILRLGGFTGPPVKFSTSTPTTVISTSDPLAADCCIDYTTSHIMSRAFAIEASDVGI
jgi:hypothetical protein